MHRTVQGRGQGMAWGGQRVRLVSWSQWAQRCSLGAAGTLDKLVGHSECTSTSHMTSSTRPPPAPGQGVPEERSHGLGPGKPQLER